MKRLVSVFAVFLALFALLAGEAIGETIVIKAITAFPKNHTNCDPVQIFIDKVNERAGGRLKIEWVGGPEVLQTFDQVHALKAGTIDAILYYPFGYMKPLMPECWAKGLSQLAAWEERKSGAYDLWDEIIAKRINAKYLGSFHSLIPFTIYVNKRITKLDDFKNLKIRAMPLYIPFLKAIGASPVIIPPPEIYTSMERGVVDGFMWPREGMASFGLQEVTKYQLTTPLFQVEPATMINLDKWNKIPKDLQDLVMDVMKDMEYIGTMRYFMLDKKEEEVKRAAGVQLISLPPEDEAKLIKTADDVTWEYVIKEAPEYGPKLKAASRRDALPKGSFPWVR
jgi:TRAP-type C4-dicarboxylate transport system substrate-binding protein